MSNGITDENYVVSWDLRNEDGSGEFRCKVVPCQASESPPQETLTYKEGWRTADWGRMTSGEAKPLPEAGGYNGMLLAALACDLMIQGMPPAEIRREFDKIPAFRKWMKYLEEDSNPETAIHRRMVSRKD